MDRLNRLRPWAVTSALSSQAAAAELGTGSARSALRQGVEERVQKYIGKKPVHYLETAREQLEIMDGFSPALQDAMVRSICQQILYPEETGSTLSQWPEWWAEGEMEPFVQAYEAENDFAEQALTEEYHQGLITRRNRRMAEGLRALLEDGEGGEDFCDGRAIASGAAGGQRFRRTEGNGVSGGTGFGVRRAGENGPG